MSDHEFTAMREANERFAQALRDNDVDAALQADDDFHEVAVVASANPMLRAVLEQVTPMLRRIERVQFSSLSGRSSVAMHDRIITLAVAGDAEAAGLAARENWQTLEPLLAMESERDQ